MTFLFPPPSSFFKQMFIFLVVLATRALLYRARRSLADSGGRGRAKQAGISRASDGGFLGQRLSLCLGPSPARRGHVVPEHGL